MDIYRKIIKNINYPLYCKALNRTDMLNSFYELKKKQCMDIKDNLYERNKLLYNIIDYAVKYVPYYKNISKEISFVYSEESITDDIKRLPILTKDIIRREGTMLYSEKDIKWRYETSGGSTGEPLQLRQGSHLPSINTDKYFLSFGGYDIGDKVLSLWGSERDIFNGSIGIKANISQKFIHRTRTLNSFCMDEVKMHDYVKYINKWRPKIIRAYVQSAYEISQFIEKNHLRVYSPSCIITSAGTLYPDWKEYIESIFKCPVLNQYGSREVNGIAISCKENNCLHINMFVNYVEVVDDVGNAVDSETPGQILVTNLRNHAMPLIRYEIGDIGAITKDDTCKCGRHTSQMAYVTGRTVNIFKTRDGKKIDGEYFTHLFYGKTWVKQFQVVQENYEYIIVYYVLSENVTDDYYISDFSEIKEKIRFIMGDDIFIDIKKCNYIKPSPSGKFIYTISKV